MSKLPNIIQRRELEPILQKADKIAKHYEIVANCAVSILRPEGYTNTNLIIHNCSQCKRRFDENSECALLHLEAAKKAKETGGSFIYTCREGLIFWTSPFYSGERYAGSLLSGGLQNNTKNNLKAKALANIMLICADQISELSFTQKNITAISGKSNYAYNSDNSYSDDEKIASFLMDMERMLLANLRRGDINEARKLLTSLLQALYKEVKADFNAFRLKVLELAVLLSRAAANPNDINDNKTIEANSQYQKRINESTSPEELKNILQDMTEKMSEKIFSFHGVRHFTALRKAERFIWANYTKKISLHEIAKVSGLSAPYFSTIFKEEMGENLSDYLNRLRVEKAASLLLTTNMSIGNIAKSCGFEDQSWFSKIFKNNTGYTPGKYRDQGSISVLSA